MKNIFITTAIALLLFNCKSDKKHEFIEPVEEIVADTILVEEIDEKPIIDTIMKIEEVTEKPKKQNIKAASKPKEPFKNYLIESDIKITPIKHGTLVIDYNGTTIYVDPVGGIDAFNQHKAPNFILITDIHGDHLSVETLNAVNTGNTIIIGPKAVKEKLPQSLQKNFTTLFSGLSRSFSTSKMALEVEGIPMYNLREEAKQYHPKGRGLGYVISMNNKRIYISGDTEDIFEMRQLKNIDIALVCMNLPYTMTVESAASAVLDFKPKKVLPYHYKGTNGFSNVSRFKTLVNKGNNQIKVVQLNWYEGS
ncbi:MBL fold metallo-hydrolase [Hanstruepera ponticola]|uniref:MBL fold metallo-hydrolase n=1 Tax=Hanstruepera ponticola TaxID=2042995 RepID=UPI001F3FE880|nr:MBL fold metallo-hydrolase [Hanstruepera ponticola]